MTVRIKRHWFREDAERGPADAASAMAAAVWKTSVHGLKSVREARFALETGLPFICVLGEFLAFLVAAADRIAYRHHAEGEWRVEFTTALVLRLAGIYQENLEHLIGQEKEGEHRRRFIDLVNSRMAAYAQFDYDLDGPDFGFRRYFGSLVEASLRDPDDRRWALDQIMSVQAPEAVDVVERGMRGLLGIDPKPGRRALESITL